MENDKKKTEEQIKKEAQQTRTPRPVGHYSNRVITARNGGVQHQFGNSIGGCGSNYR